MSTLVLTGGGTAGHCIPNIALLPFLKKDFTNIIYIGSENGIEKQIANRYEIEYYPISCCKLKRELSFDNLLIPFTLLKGINQAKSILKKIKPDVVFSKGGYVSLPVVIAASKLNIPVISHESDLTVGLANKIASRYSKKVLTSFPETAKEVKNGEYTGAPIRNELLTKQKERALNFFGFNGNKPVILITGGSQGAGAINKAIRDCLDDLLSFFDVIHVCGKNNLKIDIQKKGYYQIEYLQNMELALSASSICVSRAGSNSLFELLALNMPSVIIPLPKNASRGDQILNAEYFYKKGLITLLYQELLTPSSLLYAIYSTYNNKEIIKQNFKKFSFVNGNRTISRIISDAKR